ncbi:M20/M25/M40 family metallo-hydrolase [Peptoniphilus sp. KCTC 25270]|uniref:M20/M25/M40 family metallo-hydrolase n=1 Tax=Peptoniphilus sp. KCTC 25270 TaxID=2897414 RepID=UPI001E3F66AE|nr:M20/M25/M40 family metallo-hydrolase [Peptoniphilus sp. KCTC 25270]MCD1147375.1 M20/M25/M40 family metallo-hydrolase [Peptoniphilus sp. KCTC 25270]
MVRKNRIEELAREYVSVKTHTGTEMERNAEAFFSSYFENIPYFQENKRHRGFYPIKKDPLKRNISWAFYKGQGEKTVVLIHHSDTVDTDDFGLYKDKAYNLDQAKEVLSQGKLPLSKELKEDLSQEKWFYGRGISDMKGGGSIHLALLEEYVQEENFKGNILLLAVPDEENSSAGMRSASYLMKELKDKYNLEYVVMLDVEPHERSDEEKFTIYDGSIGKMMPIFLVRGKLAHTGQIYAGFSPIHLLSGIVRKTELDPQFVETRGTTTTPGPTWLYMKDRKYVYDVSLPLTAGGYMSVLSLSKSPLEIMETLKKSAEEAFAEVIADSKERYKPFKETSAITYGEMEYEPIVYTFDELLSLVKSQEGISLEELEEKEDAIVKGIQEGEFDRIEGSYQWMEYVLSQLNHKEPCVVIGMAAPYYPAVNNGDLPSKEKTDAFLEDFAKELKDVYGMEMEVQNYFTGICDLSYGMFTASKETIDYVENNLMLWGKDYEIPLHLIKEMSMPVFNIGPWGKELHRYGERVYQEDLLEKVPHMVDFTIRKFLEQ